MPEYRIASSLKEKQTLRKRRVGMAFLTYMIPIAITVLFCVYAMVPPEAVFIFAAYAVGVNLAFYLAIHSGLNLKFREPSLTAFQMSASLLPAVYVMYHLEDGQARAVMMLVIAVPLIYGIMALNTRQFIQVGAWFLAVYCFGLFMLWRKDPSALDAHIEFIQLVSFLLAVISSSIIGGFIYNLRRKVRNRNRELAEALKKIERLANRDALTGVYNRRRLFEALEQEVNRCMRFQKSFSVCIMDIDHFKDVNDNHGHQAGDEILREIARKISRNIRNIDCFGRYGGEEFLVILPHTPLEGAIIKAERIRKRVESLVFPDISPDFRVTVSIGATEHRPGEDIDETLARADRCLYMAKDAGRNRVVTE